MPLGATTQRGTDSRDLCAGKDHSPTWGDNSDGKLGLGYVLMCGAETPLPAAPHPPTAGTASLLDGLGATTPNRALPAHRDPWWLCGPLPITSAAMILL